MAARLRSDSSSSLEDTFASSFASAAGDDAVDAVAEFYFESPAVLDGPLRLSQPDCGGSIGFKLYPAALFCCGLLERLHAAQCAGSVCAETLLERVKQPGSRSPSSGLFARLSSIKLDGCIILELGAGICGLPSQLLARMGAVAVATVRAGVTASLSAKAL